MSLLNAKAETKFSPATTEETKELTALLEKSREKVGEVSALLRLQTELKDRVEDLIEDGNEDKRIKRCKRALDDIKVGEIKIEIEKIKTELEKLMLPNAKHAAGEVQLYQIQIANVGLRYDEAKANIERAQATIEEAENKAAEAKTSTPAAAATMGGNLDVARQVLLAQKIGAAPATTDIKLKVDGKERDIVFAVTVERGGETRYVPVKIADVDSDMLDELIPGYQEKRKFQPLSGSNATTARLMLLNVTLS